MIAVPVTALSAPNAASSWSSNQPAPASSNPARATPNDNRASAGRLADGVFTLELEAREASWHPDGASGPAVPVFGFAEVGRGVTVPGPMIRVPAGTAMRVTVRNTLSVAMRLRGLQDRVGAGLDSIIIEPGARQEVRFHADVPGTYYYWGRTDPLPARVAVGIGRDATLAGAFIVDSASAKPPKGERIFFITMWSDTLLGRSKSNEADRVLRREFIARDRWLIAAVNGLSWPHSEQLSHSVGDTVHWRVINGSPLPHPMHLHGFYFDVNARGDALRDTIFTTEQRRLAVTEWMVAGTTMRMTWVPTRPGNWLFHCHLVTHITGTQRLGVPAKPARATHHNHAEEGMAGLVLGVRVSPVRRMPVAPDPTPRRRLRLFITERENVHGDQPGYSYVLQEGPTAPAPDSVRNLSSTLILRQNEPTEIAVINVAKHTTTIHWHGIELESVNDGVGGWSGWGTRLAPPIAPGDSFVARLTPPRAGTFMYHTHVNEGITLASGLYGALLVIPEHAAPDTSDRMLLLSVGGPGDDARPVVNGSPNPPAIELHGGVAHRFRFINISPLETHTVQLTHGGAVLQWRALAKDGADLPAQQARMQPATLLLHPGETYDFEVKRERGDSLTLKIISPETITVRTAAFRAKTQPIPRIVTEIPVIVRD